MRNLWLQFKAFWQHLWSGVTNIKTITRQQVPHILENFSPKEIYILVIALLVFVLSGGFLFIVAITHRGPGPHSGGELIEGLVGQPQFINPILAATSSVDTDLSRLVYAQLLKFDKDENLVPDLAASLPSISKDQKTYTLNLRPGLKWQDGRPLNADDVLFTIQLVQNGEYSSPLRPNWSRVKITKIDDQTLTFTLREVSNSFMTNFALGVLPKHIWQDYGAQNFRLADTNLKPVGSGPFVVSEIKKTSDGTIKSITLRANNQYYLGSPYLNEITFKFYDGYDSLIAAYQGKEIQSLGFEPFDQKIFLSQSDKTNQYRINLPQYQAVFFNLPKNPILNEKAVRQALWLVTDRQSLIDEVYKGNAVPAVSPIFEKSLGYNPSITQSVHYSLDEAGQILDRAGWKIDPASHLRTKNKKVLEFSLATNGNVVINVKTAQVLQTQWEKLGIKINLVVVSSHDLEDQYIRPRAFDALLFSENVGSDPDPFAFWDSSQSHDPGLNLSGFSNTEADKLLTQARQTTDTTLRQKNYQRFAEILNDQLPAIFLVRSIYLYNVPKNLQGIDLTNIIHPSERFLNLNQWYY